MIELAANRYGKAAIRIVRVGRDTTPHALRDLTVAVAWWKLVTPDWVKQPAFAYADRLLEATSQLAE